MCIAVTRGILGTYLSATLSTDEGKSAWVHRSNLLVLRERGEGKLLWWKIQYRFAELSWEGTTALQWLKRRLPFKRVFPVKKCPSILTLQKLSRHKHRAQKVSIVPHNRNHVRYLGFLQKQNDFNEVSTNTAHGIHQHLVEAAFMFPLWIALHPFCFFLLS